MSDSITGRLVDGRYRVLSEIARGGMSTVYLANDIRLDRTVALKVMHRSFAEDPGFVARFEHEAKAAARLSHPNVVAVFDQGSYDGLVFLVMEYVPGHTLRDVIRTYGVLEPARALGVVDQVLLALTAAHAAGFVHRDIKPENVLITERGVAKVADFGLARAITGSVPTGSTQGLIIGTVAYLSPEQVEAGVVDQRSDVYSCGVMLFELLTGEVPFTAESSLAVAYRHVNDVVPAPSSIVKDVPEYVDELVLTATAKDPADRFADAWQFEQALVAAQNRIIGEPLGALTAGVEPSASESEDRTEVIQPAFTTAVLADGDPDRTTVLDGPADAAADHPVPVAVAVSPRRDEPYVPSKKIKSSSRAKRSIFIVIILLLAALVGGIGWYLGSAEYVSVPDVTGQSVDDANMVLATQNLRLAEASVEPSETVAEGLVIRTDPPVGERARTGSTLAAIVSSGPQLFNVPSVQGTSVTDATAALEQAGFTVGGTEQVYDPQIARDLLVGTNPAADTAQRAGTAVTLIVSRGLEPVVLPDFAGLPTEVAQQRASDLGLLSSVRQDFSDTVPAGAIVTSEPAAGATLVPGDTIQLVASKGPAPATVPDVVGMGQQEAMTALQEAGLQPLSKNQFPIVVLDRVYSQDPAAGTQLPRGSTVTIRIV